LEGNHLGLRDRLGISKRLIATWFAEPAPPLMAKAAANKLRA
jgi:hypothetical protein